MQRQSFVGNSTKWFILDDPGSFEGRFNMGIVVKEK